MALLETIITQQIVYKLGWALLHFIWQGGAIALLLAIVLIFLRRASANLRYILACSAIVLIAVSPVVTMLLIQAPGYQTSIDIEPVPIYETSTPTVTRQVIVTDFQVPQDLEPTEITKTEPAASWHKRVTAALEPFLPNIVSFWLVGVFGLSLWHLGGWTQLQGLRKKMVRKVEPSLLTKMELLVAKLGIKRTVGLFESALVQIPTVVGWLKPVILLPASALTGLSSEQLEAILAHELAHIKRFDYLVNMLQTIVEILGFYHPAVWWVSHKIRIERENCCDDLAVIISGDRLRYAKALTSLEEIRAGHGELAVAATGGNLLNRIRRLLSSSQNEKIAFNWIPAMIAILLLAAILIPAALALNSKSESEQPENEPSNAQKIDSSTKVLVETQIIHVNNEFLEQVGLDADSLKKSNSWTQSRVDDSGNPSMFVIDSQRKEMLLKNVDESEDSSSISRIFLMAISGQQAAS